MDQYVSEWKKFKPELLLYITHKGVQMNDLPVIGKISI